MVCPSLLATKCKDLLYNLSLPEKRCLCVVHVPDCFVFFWCVCTLFSLFLGTLALGLALLTPLPLFLHSSSLHQFVSRGVPQRGCLAQSVTCCCACWLGFFGERSPVLVVGMLRPRCSSRLSVGCGALLVRMRLSCEFCLWYSLFLQLMFFGHTCHVDQIRSSAGFAVVCSFHRGGWQGYLDITCLGSLLPLLDSDSLTENETAACKLAHNVLDHIGKPNLPETQSEASTISATEHGSRRGARNTDSQHQRKGFRVKHVRFLSATSFVCSFYLHPPTCLPLMVDLRWCDAVKVPGSGGSILFSMRRG